MKKKRYQEGGEAEGISGTAGKMTTTENKKPRTTDDMTFGQAFRAARKAGKKTFSWRGDEFNTELKKPAAKSAAKADDTPATGRSVAFEESRDVTPASKKSSAPKKTISGALAATSGTAGQRKRGAEEGYKPGDFMRALKARFGTQRMRDELAEEFGSKGRRGESVAMRRIREANEERESRKKKGGAIKAYRKGGSIDGCAKRGHTRGKII